MSGSEPEEMVLESSRAVVLPKFDMHINTSILTAKELKVSITEYCIPTDLHLILPPPELTMNKLPPRYIGIYMEQLEVILFEICCRSLDINATVPLFWVFYKLCKQGHWFSFKNKNRGLSKKFFKEVTSSLKGWKKKFFLIDRRAIPDAMPWRHIDTDLRDDFPMNYNEGDVVRLAEFTIHLRPPPRNLLYVCGLTTACRHPERSYLIKDPNRMVVSKGDPIPDDQLLKLLTTSPLEAAAAWEKKDQQNLAKAKAKCAGEEGSVAPRKKRVRRNQEPGGSGSEETSSATPLHTAASKPIDETTTIVAGNATEDARPEPQVDDDERDVVDLSEGIVCLPLRRMSSNLRLILSMGVLKRTWCFSMDTGEDATAHRFVPGWGLRDDLRICTFRAFKEMITHLATPAEEEFLARLSNVEVVRSAYKSLGRCVLSHGELLKRHEQLNHDYVELRNRDDTHLGELDRLQIDLQREMQAHDGLSKKFTLLDSAHSPCSDMERELLDQLKDMETEGDDWRRTASQQVERIKELEESLEPKTQQFANAEKRIKSLEGENTKMVAE
ncbi:hypothetical protein Tco_0215592 [Tanacetum coccineum]